MRPNPLHESTGPHYSTLPKDREARLAPGTRVVGGQLEVVEELARGGMAIVYRAIDHRHDGAEVALKVAIAGANQAETEARFRNEARLGASLAGHPHVVRPLSVGSLDGPVAGGFEGRMYLVTELVRGVSADVAMGSHLSGLPTERACRIARHVARALVDLHERGIVHRDIKPSNILLTEGDTGEHAWLIDFGLAYATGDGWEAKSPDLTAHGHAPGTALYMSPQQLAHERPEPEFDIYSFGVMLYEFFSGDPPLSGCGHGEMLARKCDPNRGPFPIAKMCPDLPSVLGELVERCMQHEPNARPSATELVEVLDGVLGERKAIGGAARWRRWWWLVPIFAGVVVAIVVFGRGSSEEERREGAVESAETSEPAAMAAASYAKVESDVPPPVVYDVAAAEPGPSAEPDRQSEPPRKVKRRKKRPVAEAVEAEPDSCPEDRRAAEEAMRAGQWKRALRLTKSAACWSGDAKAKHTRIRISALLETKRYRECVELGRRSTDPRIARLAGICETRQEQGQQ